MIENKEWTNDEILHEFLWQIIDYRHRIANESVKYINSKDFLDDKDRMIDWLIGFQGAVANFMFSFIDGTNGPSDWPGISLVNACTGEKLSDNLEWDISRIESKYLEALTN